MDTLLDSFAHAQTLHNGYLLSSTLVPLAPPLNPAYLYHIQSSSSPYSITADVRYRIQYNPSLSLSKKESSAWQELYVAFYKSVCELVNAEEVANQVRRTAGAAGDVAGEVARQWGRVYDAWRDVTNALYRGYSSGGFEAWTVPCLYVVGRYLRVFAIKADEEARRAPSTALNGAANMGEDAADTDTDNQKLEDCARQINRLFSLCVSDRYVLHITAKSTRRYRSRS